MKSLKFPAFILAFVIAITSAFAFNTKPAEAGKFSKVYYYTGGNSATDVKDPNMWIENGDPCGLPGDLPCTKNFESDLRSDFNTHILGYTTVAIAKADSDSNRQ